MHACIHTYIHTHESPGSGSKPCAVTAYMYTYIHTCITCRHSAILAYSCYHLSNHVNQTGTFIHTNKQTYIQAYIHTYIHTYIHRKALAVDPNHVPSLCNLGLLLLSFKQPREPETAEKLFLHAMDILPDHTDTLCNYATIVMVCMYTCVCVCIYIYIYM
jgi:hypothetical protein